MAQGKIIPTFITVGNQTIKSSLIAVVGAWNVGGANFRSVFEITLENRDVVRVACSKEEYDEFLSEIKSWNLV